MPALVHTVQRVVPASPQEVFDLLARPDQHRTFDGGGTVQSQVSGPERLSLGAEFRMGMKIGLPYATGNRVVEFVEGERIAWQTGVIRNGRLLLGGQVWRFELQDRGDGSTLVKESYDLTSARGGSLINRVAGSATEANMRATLERLAKHFAG
ncbi:SRPBCC family protein [Luteococcus sp. Sow4_B9]|uniref:SRPBCC family protein n=1 Tax=Luteococcus sp. Sow4_B9 TaxID=3438792 RepID=UPI003F96D9F1